jgi:hypothetical protein
MCWVRRERAEANSGGSDGEGAVFVGPGGVTGGGGAGRSVASMGLVGGGERGALLLTVLVQ